MAYEDDFFVDTTGLVWNYSFFTDKDVRAFKQGKMFNAYEKFGAHPLTVKEIAGYYFALWAPNATYVSVIGDFNGWRPELHPLFVRQDKSGIWEGFIPRLPKGALYKFHIVGFENSIGEKADPFARYAELRPGTASITWDDYFSWSDEDWLLQRSRINDNQAPYSVYELHLGSWMRPEKDNTNSFNSYEQIAGRLIPYLKGMHFTHVEFMPVMEHPLDDSWGYQCTGYFAPTSRFGKPEECMALINALHNEGIAVILDWVPSHFPADAHGLYMFDGAHTYEYADRRKGYQPDWDSYIFNYARNEVVSFLISSAHFWLNKFHADGLRVDAVNSMIRLDFSRQPGEWQPNEEGGNENLEALSFLRKLNKMAHTHFNGIKIIAEDSSDMPGITHPINKNGVGFDMKWMMGWMHDSLNYFKLNPVDRIEHRNEFTFSMMYFFNERFMLPFSHDEVVHGKSPMLYKMPGNEFEKFANLRLLYAYLFTHPGSKLLFMGNEFGQTSEWSDKTELSWELLQYKSHNQLQDFVRDLNLLYRTKQALYEYQFSPKGFEWIDIDTKARGLFIYRRMGRKREDDIVVLLNMSNSPLEQLSVQLNGKFHWKEILNSNHVSYWGSGEYKNEHISHEILDKKKKTCEIKVCLPALSAVILI
ncbi:MAG: 1,4-alpha-glucan branching protein GlgB [Ferruginibacter sp.]|nr:1,4-alpha-glucan branching protein GlgB [Ferruginibacter sp.]